MSTFCVYQLQGDPAEPEPVSAALQEPLAEPQAAASEQKDDSSPELNVEQGFLTASSTPSKGPHDSRAGQASAQKGPAGSSKHAQRDKAAERQRQDDGAKRRPSREDEASNRYTEDRKRREAAAAKVQKAVTGKADDTSRDVSTDRKGTEARDLKAVTGGFCRTSWSIS